MKEKSIWKLSLICFGKIILAWIFTSVMLLSFTALFSDDAGRINVVFMTIIQILAFIMYFSIFYPDIWESGDHDINMAEAGYIKLDKNKGLKVGLILATPYYIATLLLIYGKLVSNNFFISLFRIINMHMIYLVNLIFPPERSFENLRLIDENGKEYTELIQYNNLDYSNLGIPQIVIFLLLPLLIIIITTLAYRIGLKHIRLKEKIIFKKKDN